MSAHSTRIPLRWAHLLLLAVFAISFLPTEGTGAQEVPELQINSAAYIVIDADTGEVFAQKNADERRAMASLTKVFTLIEALKRAPLNMLITTEAGDLYTEDSSLMGFGAGETFTLEELLYGLMLPSGNDAAHAIARALGAQPGDTDEDAGYERFVGWLNERVQEMGLEDTQLINPHGWGVPGHYTTGHDLAAFVRYALQEPEFVKIFGTETYVTSNGYELRNNNRLMYSYDALIGGKTGYDWDAGYCLIAVAQRNGHTAISVTFDGIAPDDWYDDNRVLLEYALDQMEDRGSEVRGEIVTYTNPDLAQLSRAQSTSALAGHELQSVAASSEGAAHTAQAPAAGEASSEAENATSGATDAPGLNLPLAIALAVMAAFVALAGRGLRLADASLGRTARSFFGLDSIRLPSLPRPSVRLLRRPEKPPTD